MPTTPDISLLDSSLLDELLFDDATAGGSPPTVSDDVQFNGFGLQNAQIKTTKIDYSGPIRALGETASPRSHGEFIQTDYWQKTIITLSGSIKGSSRTDMETNMDVLRQNLGVGNGILQLPWKGGLRYWNAYVQIDKIFVSRDHYNVNWCKWEATFLCASPFGRDGSRTVLSILTPCTVNPTTYEPQNFGSAPTDSIWNFVFSTAATCTSITLTNTTTGEAIVVSAAFADGDTLVLDGEQRTVKLNGVPVDYTGVFPSLNPGKNTFTLEPNGAGFSITVQELHYNRYL